MSTETCQTVVTYKVPEDALVEPFRTQRIDKAIAMFEQGKSIFWHNVGEQEGTDGRVQLRFWTDRAAAQEFIDYITPLAVSYGIEISTAIEDF